MFLKKLSKAKIILGAASAVTLASTTSLAIVATGNNTNFSNSFINQEESLINFYKYADSNSIKPLIPSQANGQNSFISTSQGPLVYWNNKITSLDWYGAERWSIDFSTSEYVPASNYTGAWRRAWFNWDYDRSRNILWVLGYGDSKIEQKIFSIDATTGKTIKTINTGSKGTLKFVSALSSGNVLMWEGATSTYNAKARLYDSQTGNVSEITGNSVSAMNGIDGNGTASNNKYRWYFTNTIPIKSGYNFAVLWVFQLFQQQTIMVQ